jgi:hypothetical protein
VSCGGDGLIAYTDINRIRETAACTFHCHAGTGRISVLRIQDVYPEIPDPTCFYPGSELFHPRSELFHPRSASKNFKYFNEKNGF